MTSLATMAGLTFTGARRPVTPGWYEACAPGAGTIGMDRPRHDRVGRCIALDRDLWCVIGHGRAPDAAGRLDVRFSFADDASDGVMRVDTAPFDDEGQAGSTLIAMSGEACRRLFDFTPTPGCWFLSSALRRILCDIAGTDPDEAGRELYLRGKGLELACETIAQLRADALVPLYGTDILSEADTRRIIAARTLIEDRLHDPLTLVCIARHCGLNRSKLTRGFRYMFGVTVAEYLITCRMQHAKSLLLTTKLSVARVGHASGFGNNASFSRAFARYFGMGPSAMRAERAGRPTATAATGRRITPSAQSFANIRR